MAHPCPICSHVDREGIELAYITGDRDYAMPFTRAQVERHMSHVAEPEALKLVLGMSSATALAARARHIENMATQILDKAMSEGNANLALKAIRELRPTMELQGRIAGSLVDRVAIDQARPDLDDAIAAKLKVRATMGEEQAPAEPREQLALPPGTTEAPEGEPPGA